MSTTEQVEAQAADLPEIPPMPVAIQFASRGRHLTLERVRPTRVVDAGGGVHWTNGISYEFQEGVLLLYPRQDVLPDLFDPATGQMLEQDALGWARNHELYGTDRGFWEVDPVAPDAAPLLTAIMQLAVKAGNPDTRAAAEAKLVEIHEIEAESWKRAPVLDGCKVALAAIESQAALSEPAPVEPTAAVTADTADPLAAMRDADGVLQVNPDAIASSGFTGEREHNLHLGGAFRPDSAPVKEG